VKVETFANSSHLISRVTLRERNYHEQGTTNPS